MKYSNILVLALLITSISFTSSNAQFGSLKNKIQKKIEKKIEDQVVEELSDRIAESAFKPIEKAMDNWFKTTYDADTTETGEIDWEKFNGRYEEMLNNLNEEANLPDAYNFDISLDVEVNDYNDDKYESKMHYIKGKAIFGFEQIESKSSKTFIVMDNENDLMAIYTEEDGKKSAQAIPSMMSMATMFGASQKSNMEEKLGTLKIEKTGKTKKIAGFKSSEYEGENNDEDILFYIAEDFPISWMDTYGDFVKNYMPDTYAELVSKTKGMVMYSQSQRRDNKKQKSSWEVKKVHKDHFKINNGDWTFERIGENN